MLQHEAVQRRVQSHGLISLSGEVVVFLEDFDQVSGKVELRVGFCQVVLVDLLAEFEVKLDP